MYPLNFIWDVCVIIANYEVNLEELIKANSKKLIFACTNFCE